MELKFFRSNVKSNPLIVGYNKMGGGIARAITNTYGSGSLLINPIKQAIHNINSPKYKKGRSYLTITNDMAQSLIDANIERGTHINAPYGNKVRIDFGRPIGYYVDPQTNIAYETTIGIVHTSKKGCHLVPQRPIGYTGGK